MRRLVIFDIDGTLTDSYEVDGQCFTEALKEFVGLELEDQAWEKFTHVTDRGILQECFRKFFHRELTPAEEMNMTVRFLQKLRRHAEEIKEIPGAGALFNALRKHQTYCPALATGGWRPGAELKLEAARIPWRGVPLATSSEAVSREEILRNCILESQAHYGVDHFESIVSVGDALWDLQTAQNLNLDFLAIGNSNKFQEYPEVKQLPYFPESAEFIAELESLQGGMTKQRRKTP